jgi:hypothetical protein
MPWWRKAGKRNPWTDWFQGRLLGPFPAAGPADAIAFCGFRTNTFPLGAVTVGPGDGFAATPPAKLYQRHNRTASSFDPKPQEEAESMPETRAGLRDQSFGSSFTPGNQTRLPGRF